MYLMNHAKPMDQFEVVMLGLAFALAAAIWAFGRRVRFVLAGR
jgi:hypothetical protein